MSFNKDDVDPGSSISIDLCDERLALSRAIENGHGSLLGSLSGQEKQGSWWLRVDTATNQSCALRHEGHAAVVRGQP